MIYNISANQYFPNYRWLCQSVIAPGSFSGVLWFLKIKRAHGVGLKCELDRSVSFFPDNYLLFSLSNNMILTIAASSCFRPTKPARVCILKAHVSEQGEYVGLYVQNLTCTSSWDGFIKLSHNEGKKNKQNLASLGTVHSKKSWGGNHKRPSSFPGDKIECCVDWFTSVLLYRIVPSHWNPHFSKAISFVS